ncbi:MAG: hypothetical protein JJV93_00680 [Alphaproteobacteria bacterium]|nr:hypothetical protein [Alphaproteobacteria bacterium]MBL0717768.1 hypothetical protein [Alphaproteobacteria bacterium]
MDFNLRFPLVGSPKHNQLCSILDNACWGLKRELTELQNLQSSKSSLKDFSTKTWKRIAYKIKRNIAESYPEIELITSNKAPSSGDYIVVNIQGIDNFEHALSNISVSLGLVQEGELNIAIVLDPIEEIIFSAEKGEGANRWTVDGKSKLRISQRTECEELLFSLHVEDVPTACKLIKQKYHTKFRMSGNPIYDLMLLASGKIDSAIIQEMPKFQISPALLIVKEAVGGIIYNSPFIIATNDKHSCLNLDT